MPDILHSEVMFGGTGNMASMSGLVTLSDNHGNSTRGYMLNCANQKPIRLPIDQWIALHHAIEPHAFRAINLDGSIPMLHGVESPLQTMCRKLEAQQHHQPKLNQGHSH